MPRKRFLPVSTRGDTKAFRDLVSLRRDGDGNSLLQTKTALDNN